MQKVSMFIIFLIAGIGCTNNIDVVQNEVESWDLVFPEITERIHEAKVNGDELHLLTEVFFYRIAGDKILEKRSLEKPFNNNYSNPVLGRHLFCRLVNYDSIAFLEIHTTAPGGNVVRLSYDQFGDDIFTFPITHGFGGRNFGSFGADNEFLFAGFDYPDIQQFISILEIEYDSVSNIINDVSIVNRIDFTPNISLSGSPFKTEDVYSINGIYFVFVGNGGLYRYEENSFEYIPEISLSHIIQEQNIFIGSGCRGLYMSNDLGKTWITSDMDLQNGCILQKEGSVFIESSEYKQLLKVGKSIEELIPVNLTFSTESVIQAEIIFYNGKYYLYGDIQGKNQIYRRSTIQ